MNALTYTTMDKLKKILRGIYSVKLKYFTGVLPQKLPPETNKIKATANKF